MTDADSPLPLRPPLCPAGHLPLKGGDRLSSRHAPNLQSFRRRASGAAGGGGAIGRGAQAIVMQNDKGAVLELTGDQRGLQINADLSGLSITVK